MAQIKIVDPSQATGKSKELLTALQNNIKSVPNLAKALANSPAALKAWMEFDGALAKGSLNAKLRQEIAGVPPKDLQNLVQLGIIRPARRNSVCWFDTNLLLEAKVAFYLKETLGSSSDLLARFTEAFSKNLGKTKIGDLGDICLRSRPLNGTDAVEIKIPVRSLAQELEDLGPRLTRTFPRAARELAGRGISCGASKRLPPIWAASQKKRF